MLKFEVWGWGSHPHFDLKMTDTYNSWVTWLILQATDSGKVSLAVDCTEPPSGPVWLTALGIPPQHLCINLCLYPLSTYALTYVMYMYIHVCTYMYMYITYLHVHVYSIHMHIHVYMYYMYIMCIHVCTPCTCICLHVHVTMRWYM